MNKKQIEKLKELKKILDTQSECVDFRMGLEENSKMLKIVNELLKEKTTTL